MSWFNRYVIGSLSPRWALSRERHARGLNAYYEATEPSRTRKSRQRAGSADIVNDRSGVKLRDMGRHLEENLDIASGILDVLVNHAIGTGIIPEPLVETTDGEPAEDFNLALMRLYDLWLYECEVTRQFDKYSLERVVGRSWFRDGECFGQRIIGAVPGLQHSTVLPYSLQGFEADFVPYDLDDPAKNLRQGIEHDKWGRAKRFHVYKHHPGDRNFSVSFADTAPIDADRVMHLKMVKRLHQTRGITIFASALARLDDIKEIDESERVAARVAAMMAAYVKKGTPEMYSAPAVGPDGTVRQREMDMMPGMFFDGLAAGEEVGTIASTRPNNALIPFRDAQLRAAAAGVGASYSSISKNYNGTYSAQRQELVEQFGTYAALSTHFIHRWSQPVWDGFIDAVLASGAIEVGANVDRETLYNVSHTAPSMPWIDPESEGTAQALAEDRGWQSKSGTIRKRGGNPAQVRREIQRDKQEDARLGLSGEPQEPSKDNDQAQKTARAVVRLIQRRSK